MVAEVCASLRLPSSAVQSLSIVGDPHLRYFASSFKIDSLAQGTIAAFALAVSHHHALVAGEQPSAVTVSPLGTALEFVSERMCTINGRVQPVPQSIGGLYRTRDGAVRIHDGFKVHRLAAKAILGIDKTAGRETVAKACSERGALELEQAALADCAIIYALRSFAEWDALPQATHMPSSPVQIRPLGSPEPAAPVAHRGASAAHVRAGPASEGCLRGLRVLELSRVIAAPVAGRALAAHGADVLWVTCPNLEAQPYLDCDFSRGKRQISLDLDEHADMEHLKDLIRKADVFIQAYRPGSLAKRGLGPEDLRKLNAGIVYGSLSAHPRVDGHPWRLKRGFDSMVQTCSGINVADAQAFNHGLPPEKQALAKVLPCQALDHATGFLLAAGVVGALSRKVKGGGAFLVEASLAGTAAFLRSLGQFPERQGFEGLDKEIRPYDDVVKVPRNGAGALFAEADSDFGRMRFIRPAGLIEGARVGWALMPRRLVPKKAEWL